MKKRIDSIIEINGERTPYISFGKGSRALVLIPGLSEGLKSIEGTAFLMEQYYRELAKNFRVYIIGRPSNMPKNYSVENMAGSLCKVLDALNLSHICLGGFSLGGMIAQHLVLIRPDLVSRLALIVTTAKSDAKLGQKVERWIGMAQKSNYKALIRSTMEETYSQAYLKRMKPFIPFFSLFGKPKSFERFIIQSEAVLTHDCTSQLKKITIPTLVYAGGEDILVGRKAGDELARLIPGARLIVKPELGHGAFEEDKSFNALLTQFMMES
jgi:pimeloyl-ACP methyl ester carboxylesterase